MESIRLASRAAHTVPGPCLYAYTTFPLEVHEEKVHNNVYASSRAETTRYGPQSISAVVQRGARNVMERRSQDVGRGSKIIFPNESRGDHDGARLSRIRIFLRAGGPRILCMR